MKALPLAFALLAAASPALAVSEVRAPEVLSTHSTWLVRKADKWPDVRIYRRYTVSHDGQIPNVIMLHCPRNPNIYVHISFVLLKVRPELSRDFDSSFEKFEGRFFINEERTFSIPGEFLTTQLFFDRTPETSQDFDSVLNSKKFTLMFGKNNAKVSFTVVPEMTKLMPELISHSSFGPATYFNTKSAMNDCRRFRREI